MKVLKCTFFLILAVLLFGLLSCGDSDLQGKNPLVTTTPEPTIPPEPTTIDLVADGYAIVYNGKSSSDIRLKTLLNTMLSREGIALSAKEEGETISDFEIVLTDVLTRDNAPALKQSYLSNASAYIGAYAMRVADGKLYLSASSSEAEQILVQKLLSFKTDGGLAVSRTLDMLVYFDLSEYKRSNTVMEISASELLTMTDLVSIKLDGEPLVQIEKGKYTYEYGIDGLSAPPTFDGIQVLSYHPGITSTVSMSGKWLTILVKARDGSTQKEYKIEMKAVSEYDVPSEIVNKDGTKGVLTLISDDGDQRTSDFFYTEIVPNYPAFRLTVAMPTNKIASLSKTSDGKAWLKDGDKYVLTIKNNTYNSIIPGSLFQSASTYYPTMVDYWKQIVSCGAIELASHSHTHAAWGLTDEQNGSYPAGNVIKELHASAQILRDLIGQDTPFILRPGGHDDLTSPYFYSLVASDDTFLGMRTSNGAPPLATGSTKLNTVSKFTNPDERLKIATILVRSYEAAFNETRDGFATTSSSTIEQRLSAGVSAWTNYVDLAIQNGAWASIGFHSVVSDTTNASGYAVFDSQVKALMDYVQPLVDSGDLWLGSFAEVAKYYFEWSSATLSTKIVDDVVEIRLTDKEEDERFDMPLTVKITVPYLWQSAVLTTAGQDSLLEIHTDTDGTHFVYANVVPSEAISTIRSAN